MVGQGARKEVRLQALTGNSRALVDGVARHLDLVERRAGRRPEAQMLASLDPRSRLYRLEGALDVVGTGIFHYALLERYRNPEPREEVTVSLREWVTNVLDLNTPDRVADYKWTIRQPGSKAGLVLSSFYSTMAVPIVRWYMYHVPIS